MTSECADAMRVSEHYTSTPCTRTQRLTIKRMVSKCRTRQPESCDTLFACFRDWLERGVQTDLPTDLRLDDGRRWQRVKALPLPSPGASVRSGSTHMTTDAKHVENLAALPESRSSTPSSRVIDHEQRDVTELSTAAEAAMFRRVWGRFVPRIERARIAGTTRRKSAQTSQCQCSGGELAD